MREGFALLAQYPKSVSIFGSSLVPEDSKSYQAAVELSKRIAVETGHAVVTGGGPGVMEAANKGAYQAGGQSLGLTISLPHEHHANEFVSDGMHFGYFFSRKVMLTFAAEAYIFFPGGYGTLDELFSILTLIQTGKIPRVPVILYDTHFWQAFLEFMNKAMIRDYNTIAERDLEFLEVTDSLDRIIQILQAAPVHEWSRNIN